MTNEAYHLSIDQFVNLRIDPESANDDEIDHLIDCTTCRNKIATIDHYFENSALCLTQNPNAPISTIANTKMDSKEALLPISLLKPKDDLAAEDVINLTDFRNRKKDSQKRKAIALPRWSIAASLFLSVSLGFWISNSQDQDFIVTYQDSAVISITQPAVGIGFFDEQKIQRQSIENVILVENDSKLIIMKWPDFAKTNQYQIVINEAHSDIIIDSVASGLKLELPKTKFIENRNYQWSIKANGKDKLVYELQGGFILQNEH